MCIMLREMVPDDAEPLFRMESQPAIVRYQYYSPFTRERAETYVKEAIEAAGQVPRTWMELSIIRDGLFIGRVGGSLGWPEAMIWYAVDTPFQRQGFATEAVRQFLAILSQRGFTKVSLECDPANEASWHLAERLGFQRDDELTTEDSWTYERILGAL